MVQIAEDRRISELEISAAELEKLLLRSRVKISQQHPTGFSIIELTDKSLIEIRLPFRKFISVHP